jgi:DNA-binding transcriptional regulator GbsR (MarR family)
MFVPSKLFNMSNKISLRKRQVELIEESAILHEKAGMQPAMAKIISLLYVSDETELTFDQIQDTLGLSKSGTSQTINQLLATKRIAYKTKIGARKRFFYIPVNDWKAIVNGHFEGASAMFALNNKILAERTDKTKEFNKNFKEMTLFLADVHKAISKMLADKV